MDTALTHFIAAVTEALRGTNLFKVPRGPAWSLPPCRQGRWPPWGAVNCVLLRALQSPRDNSDGPMGFINPLKNKCNGLRDGMF